MKKLFSVILAVLIATVSVIPVFAEKTQEEEYDISINVPNIMVFDDKASENKDAGAEAIYVISIKTCNMWDIKEIDLCYNIKDDPLAPPEYPFSEPIYRRVSTNTSVDDNGNYHLIFNWDKNENDNYSDENGLYGYGKFQYVVKSTGEFSFDVIGGTVTTFDGKIREAKIKINDYCKKIVNKSELILLENDGQTPYVYLHDEKKASDILAMYSAPEMRISDSDGNVLSSDDIVGTGTVVDALFKGYSYDYRLVIYLCDVSADGKVTAADARLALRASANLETLSDVFLLAADVNGDGSVSAADARLILRKSARL